MFLPVDTNKQAAHAGTTIVTRTASAPVGSDGTALVQFSPVEAGTFWLVDRLMVIGAGGGRCYVYDDPALPDLAVLDGTTSGDFDIAEYPQGLQIDETKTLCLRWVDATPGDTATARAQLRILYK